MSGCGCGGGGGNKNAVKEDQQLFKSAPSVQHFKQQESEKCNYTVELLQSWLTKLSNLKISQNVDLVGITYPLLNSYIGYVKSALNYTNNICYFSKELAPIVQVINKIDNAGL